MANYIIKNVFERMISIFEPPITNKVIRTDVSIADIYGYITTDKDLERKTNAYRSIADQKEKRDFKTTEFPLATPSGIFSRCEDKALVKHSGVICMDIDDLEVEELLRLIKSVIADVAHTIMFFISPSGDGLKIFYGVNLEVYAQAQWYEAYRQYVSVLGGISVDRIDKSCKNVSRGCFLCSDDTAYLTSNLIDGEIGVYTIDPDEYLIRKPIIIEAAEKMSLNAGLDFFNKNAEDNFQVLYSITEAKEGAYGSPRQTWIHKLVCRCNKFGMLEMYCLAYILKYIATHPESLRKQKPIDEKSYIYNTVKDVYSRYKPDFGTWTKDKGQVDRNSPFFNEDVFDNLPDFFKAFVNRFSGREKDVVLIGALGLLSGIMPNVRGCYGGATVFSNLFVFIRAGAASGKGCLRFVKLLGDEIHRYFIDNYKTRSENYQVQLENYKESKNKQDLTKPEEPKKERFFIPGNNSSSAMIKGLADNNNRGVIFETEADSLSESLKQDWGNFSDLLRKAFHHEPVSQMRRRDEEDLELSEPALSLVLSGTPNQLTKLIPDPENSRVAFYVYESPMIWKDVFEKVEESHDLVFKRLGSQVKAMYDVFNRGKIITFKLTKEQEDLLNSTFDQWLKEFQGSLGESSNASIFRLGLINFRICMILTAIRWYQEDDLTFGELVCSNQDFDTALSISETLMEHVKIVLGGLPTKTKDIDYRSMEKICGVSKSKIQKFYKG